MKHYLALLAIGAFVLLAGCSGKEENSSSEPLEKYVHIPPTLPDSVYGQLKPGDIIIRKGNGPLSDHIMHNTKEEYTHCGIIVKEGDVWKVIHSLGETASDQETDGVQMMDLSEFVKHGADSMLYICRPIFADSLEYKIPGRAYHYLEQKVPFDHRFSLFSPEKFYCSELLFYVFKDVNNGKNVFVVKKQHNSYMLMFSTFFDETKFMPIFHLRDDNRKKNGYVQPSAIQDSSSTDLP